MPYRHAHWFVLALFPLAALAFWPNYLNQLTTAGPALHAHGITASLWVALLAWQSWTIHRKQRGRHRIAGLLSLVLFPLFLAGGVSIFIGMAQRYAAEVSPFHVMYAPKLAWLDVVAVTGFTLFYFLALKSRHKVHVHARYMLATALFLIPPILSRLSPFVPGLGVEGPADMVKIGIGVQIANSIALTIALALALLPRKHGQPFFVAAGMIAVSMVLFATVGEWASWQALFVRFADLPVVPVMLATAVAGALVAWAGWTAGRRRPGSPSPQPA